MLEKGTGAFTFRATHVHERTTPQASVSPEALGSCCEKATAPLGHHWNVRVGRLPLFHPEGPFS